MLAASASSPCAGEFNSTVRMRVYLLRIRKGPANPPHRVHWACLDANFSYD
jgi:hypothetical protein